MRFAHSFLALPLASSASCLAIENNQTAKLSFNKLYGNSFQEATPDKRHRNDDDEVSLETNQNTYYSVDLAIGTPGQNISVHLDTGSSDLWVIQQGGLQCPSDSSVYLDHSNQVSDDDYFSSLINSLNQELSSILEATGILSPTPGPTGTFSRLYPSPTGSGTYGGESTNCALAAYFDPSKSKTFQKNHTDPYYIAYADLTYASGYWGTDDVTIGQLKVHNMSFAVADQTNCTEPVFGIGLVGGESSERRAAHPHEYANFPQLLKDEGIIQRVAYSLHLSSPNATDGTVLFGAVDKSQYKGQLYSFPIVKLGEIDDDWTPYHRLAITLDNVSVTVNGSKDTVSTESISTVLDSGTTYMSLPHEIVNSIVSKFNGFSSPDGIGYIIDCPSSEDKINFSFGPLTIETDIGNYIFRKDGECVLAVFPSDGILNTLGDVFLVNAYVVYDLEGMQIALAQASFDSSKEDIVPITSVGIPDALYTSKEPGSQKPI